MLCFSEVDQPGSGLKSNPLPGFQSFHDRVEEMKKAQEKEKAEKENEKKKDL